MPAYPQFEPSDCSVARTLDVLGDTWSILPRFEYHLTRKGLDLQPVVIGLMQWGDRYVADAGGGPVVIEHRACGHPVRAVTLCEACDEPVSPRQITARPRDSR